MVRVNAHVAFRCSGQLDFSRGFSHGINVEATGFLDSSLPQPRAKIGSLSYVTDDAVFTPALFERLDEGLVVFVVQRLEVLHRGVETFHVLATDTQHFVFGHGDGHDGLAVGGDTGCVELFPPGDVGATNNAGVNDVRLFQADLVDQRTEVGVAQRVVLLAHYFATEYVFNVLARDLVGGTWPDVVGTNQVEGFGVFLFSNPVQAGDDLLGGFLAGVDYVLGLLQPFIESRVVEHAVFFLEDRQYGFARGRGPAAEYGRYAVLHQQLAGFLGEGRPVTGAVFLNDLDLTTQHTTHRVDLLNGEHLCFYRTGLTDRHGAGNRVENTYLNCVISHGQPSGIDLSRRHVCGAGHAGQAQACAQSQTDQAALPGRLAAF